MAAQASMKISIPFDQLGQVVAGTARELFPSMIQLDQPWSADPPEAYCPRCGSGWCVWGVSAHRWPSAFEI